MIVGNLDAEADWARAVGLRAPGLSRAARAVAAANATLLRAFARGDDDRLALVAAIDPARVAPVPGLPRPRLEIIGDGAGGDGAGGDGHLLSWATTSRVLGASVPRPRPLSLGALVHEQAWAWPRATASAARQANDRRFALACALEEGTALPGSAVVSTLDELTRGIRAIGGPWVAKAPWAAACRWRVRSDIAALDETTEPRAARLLERFGALVLEPWCARTSDRGIAGVQTDEGTRLLGAHRLLVDAHGRFLGIATRGRFRDPDDLEPIGSDEESAWKRVIAAVGHHLDRIGYRGPFGIDAWYWRGNDDVVRFHPLGEINARMTFGLVARALIDRVRAPLGIEDRDWVTLRFGRGAVPSGGVPLLLPGTDPTCAWLEIARDGSARGGARDEDMSGQVVRG